MNHSIRRSIFLGVACLTSFIVPARAQRPTLTFLNFDDEQGLTQSSGNTLVQDAFGFIWVGTQDGLNRFDGYQFQGMKHETGNAASLPGNWVYALFRDSANRILVGTAEGGAVLDVSTGRFTPLPLQENGQAQQVTCFGEDGRGRVFVGTSDALYILDENLKTVRRRFSRPTPYTEVPSFYVRTMVPDPRAPEAMWIATRAGGLYYFDGSVFTKIKDIPDTVRGLAAVGETLWLGTTDQGLFRLSPRTGEIRNFRHDPDQGTGPADNSITALLHTPQGLWVGTRRGLSLYDLKADVFHTYRHRPGNARTLSGDMVLSLFEDAQGMVWVGTQGSGLSRYDPAGAVLGARVHDPADSRSLPSGDLRGFAEDRRGRLWMATFVDLIRYNDRTDSFYTVPRDTPDHPIAGQPILALTCDARDNLWIGGMHGLFSYSLSEQRFTRKRHDPDNPDSPGSDAVVSLASGRDGSVWMGHRLTGLSRYHPDTDSFSRYEAAPDDPTALKDNYVLSMLEDHQGRLWVGTFSGGLHRMLPEGGFVHYTREAHGLTDNTVLSLLEDTRAGLWVGTRGGLFVLKAGATRFERFDEKRGMPNHTVYGVLEDKAGRIWAATNVGLACIDPIRGTVQSYYREDGLQGNEFNANAYLKRGNGALVFGGTEGLNQFFGENVPEVFHTPKVVLTELRLFNRPVTPTSEEMLLTRQIWETETLNLSYHDNVFSFQFSSLGLNNTRHLEYAYQMSGFDKDWLPTDGSNRFAVYTNLPPGSYTFQVKARSGTSWSPDAARVQVRVQPPIWRTRGAYAGYGLCLLILSAAVYWNIQRGRRVLEARVAERTAQLYRQNEMLDTRNRELEGIDHIVRTINVQIRAEAVLQVLTDQIYALFHGADRVSCFLLDPERDVYLIVASHGFGDEAHKDTVVPRAVLDTRYSGTTEEVAEGIRVARFFRDKMGEHRLDNIPLPESLVAMTIVLNGQTVGYVVIDNLTNPTAFQGSDFQMLGRLRQHAISTLLRSRQIADLVAAQRKLADAAHAAGMAESAIDVLHHMGNKLNSVKTTAQHVRELALRDEVPTLLARLAHKLQNEDMVAEIIQDPDRRDKLHRLLERAAERLVLQLHGLRQESETLDALIQGLTEDMLAQQDATGPAPETVLASLDINAVVTDALQNETYLLREKNITLEKQLQPLPPVMANRGRMQRVLAYLLENAREAMPARMGRLQVRTDLYEGQARVSLTDNGKGIDEHLLETVFRDGFSTKAGRRGFGLHYCANTLKEMRGNIEVASAGPGQGTRVTLYLTLAEQPVVQESA